ncbi:hypothetical protein ACFL0T_06395 [Candidatus Omnitrophota bacterium]
MKKTKVAEVTFYPLHPNQKGVIGIASCVFDDKLKLDCISVYTLPDGSDFHLAFPTLSLPHGKIVNVYYPINRDVSLDLKMAIRRKIEGLTQKTTGRHKTDNMHYEPCTDID